MRIAIDARMLTYTGIGRYTQNLIINLAKIDKKNNYNILINNDCTPPALNGNVRFHRSGYNIPVYSLREQSLLPIKLGGLKPDVIHYPSFNMPFLSPSKPTVTTLHDLIYFLFPGACPNRAAYLYAKVMIGFAARNAGKIITVSNYSKDEIVKHLKIDPGKVVVIHNGVSGIYRPEESEEKLKGLLGKYNIDASYILYVGNHQERKNLLGLIRAYSLLRLKKDFLLVIAGKTDARKEKTYRAVEELGLGQRVRFIGEVPEEELPVLYSAASLFVFPSFYEGFGLPPLEAMACGTPVVTSNATSLPEVVGEAALKVEPGDATALSSAMESILSSRDLSAELHEKGFERAALFNWEDTAKKTLDVYNEVLEGEGCARS
ncbi:MAG: glycosyltransferase family 1 protein [Thermodesulfobacteriota bacterium]|nr:MAG: glycosyltransferase family 1 protein [Thermodesulfobacteriota bacterium]